MLQTVDRALRLLLLFEEVGQEYRVGELAAMLGVDKSIASRLAATLAKRGFLERAPGSEAFRLGLEVGRLGMLVLGSSHNLIELARGTMERLAEETGETVNLARLEGNKAVNIAQVDGPHLVGVGDWTGWKTEPHATANGKVLLAFAGSEFEDLPLETPLKAFTEQTITSPRKLRSELERVRSEGWGATLGELEEGFNGVAVPVFDAAGRCLAALSVSGPVYRMPQARLPEVAALCEKAAEEISARLGRIRSTARVPDEASFS
ncbi:MAG: IclR family transcriptional regulator [Actinobacteria bacterium]|nr:IclR family transcriptional regulator [Actinomycetota bacterium]